MREIETDYLVVGAGASGMGFVDELVRASDAEVVMVDRRHRPGGHWNDAYPFVRLHMPSAFYGVSSRALGNDRIDAEGPNAGFYERATAAEICDYYGRVLDEQLLPSGRVRFLGMTDYQGVVGERHRLESRLTGEATAVNVRRKLVDATYMESSIPATHTPAFDVDADATLVTPNDLVELGQAPSGYTVIGAGKTAMDTCGFLMDHGVSPDAIRWIRARDPWVLERAFQQPLEQVGAFLEFNSLVVEAACEAADVADLCHRLEDRGVMARLDPDVEPDVVRGAIVSARELEALRTVRDVVRMGRVRRIRTDGVTLDEGTIPSDPGHVHVDCTAAGVRNVTPRPIFAGERITMQLITIGAATWGAATVGFVEATRSDDAEKNRLCPPVSIPGDLSAAPALLHTALSSQGVRTADPELAAWSAGSRLNPARAVPEHMHEPRVQSALERMLKYMPGALANLERLRV